MDQDRIKKLREEWLEEEGIAHIKDGIFLISTAATMRRTICPGITRRSLAGIAVQT